MMSEVTDGAAVDTQQTEADLSVPEEITADTFAQLAELAEKDGIRRIPGTMAPATTVAESEGSSETEPSNDGLANEAPTPDPQQQQQQLQALIAQTVAATMAGQQQQQPQQSQVEPDLLEQIAQENQGMDRDGVKWFVDNVQKVIQSELNRELGAVKNDLNSVKGAVGAAQQDNTVKQYENHMNTLLDSAGVDNEFERESLRAMTTQRGLDGWRNNNQQFNLDRATQIFRNLNNSRLESSHSDRKQYVADKQSSSNSAPPQQVSTGNASAAESIYKRLRDPEDKAMNFNAGDFTKTVREFMKKGTQGALGGE
jgi:hypothetical protein|tara:strand:- start:70 stop:1005 length:936 start_codon:yes stop_codon:yes gene_type:complete